MGQRTLVSFDWAAKSLLRQKANFDILEGFLSETLYENVTVKSILESESNKVHNDDKYNQVDVFCENSKNKFLKVNYLLAGCLSNSPETLPIFLIVNTYSFNSSFGLSAVKI